MLDQTIRNNLSIHSECIGRAMEGDVLSYMGSISPLWLKDFRRAVETIARKEGKRDRLVIILSTGGGSVEAAETMVEIMRAKYNEVYFVVPEEAMSAGTILCMSGDKIFMDDAAALGPIDPQVLIQKEGEQTHFVPALGYLDKAEELVKKSEDGTITPVEFQKFLSIDLAELRRYEQARDLSVHLLKTWLVEYKFKDWNFHQSNPDIMGQPVTPDERIDRAASIAEKLADNKTWHSHGRRIGVKTLEEVLNIKIDSCGPDSLLCEPIRLYNDIMTDYVYRQGLRIFIHYT